MKLGVFCFVFGAMPKMKKEAYINLVVRWNVSKLCWLPYRIPLTTLRDYHVVPPRNDDHFSHFSYLKSIYSISHLHLLNSSSVFLIWGKISSVTFLTLIVVAHDITILVYLCTPSSIIQWSSNRYISIGYCVSALFTLSAWCLSYTKFSINILGERFRSSVPRDSRYSISRLFSISESGISSTGRSQARSASSLIQNHRSILAGIGIW